MYRALGSLPQSQSFEQILSTNIHSSFTPELLQVKYSGRSYVTVKPSTFEELRQKTLRLLKLAANSNISIGVQLPSFGDESLEIDPVAWPVLRRQVQTVNIRAMHPCSSCCGRWELFVKTTPNKIVTIHVNDTDTITYVKDKIQDQEGPPSGDERLIFAGRQLEDEKTVGHYGITTGSTIHLAQRLRGGKPVIYLLTPTPIDVSVTLSLIPSWSFSAIYPSPTNQASNLKGDNVVWNVHAQPDGTLRCQNTQTDIAYLYWEALSNSPVEDMDTPPPSPRLPLAILAFDPAAPVVNASNSALLAMNEVPKYLDITLLQLGLHVEARTSFITYWLPSLLKHTHVALRFLPQEEYEAAAPMSVSPAPVLTTRVFMLFKGIPESSRGDWARDSTGMFDWAKVVGVQDAAAVCKGDGLRVLEWGGMEVHN